MTPKQRTAWVQKQLAPVRGAIHGWAFADRDGRLARIEAAERIVDGIADSEVRRHAEKMIDDVKRTVDTGSDS